MYPQRVLTKTESKDPTAWELYKLEHPELNGIQRLWRFIALTFGVMIAVLGSVLLLQQPGFLLTAALVAGSALVIKRFK